MTALDTAVPLDLVPRVASTDIASHAVPTSADEAWRFAGLAALRPLLDPIPDAGLVRAESSSALVVNDDDALATWWLPTDRAGAVALAGSRSQARVDIPAGADLNDVIGVKLVATASPAMMNAVISAGPHARAVVVVETDTDSDVSGSIVIDADAGAELVVVLLAPEGRQERAITHVPVRVGRDAQVTVVTVVLGHGTTRWQTSARFAGPGGSVHVVGAFLVQGEGRLEQRVLVEHDQPHCTSRVEYKGALSGRGARSAWVGDVVVRSTAVGTDTYEMNRNLLLDEGPRADSVPNLELETGDVARAGHASATGRFDEEQLFYLQARGIPEAQARQLVVRGFFAEVLAAVPDASLRTLLDREIARRLGLDLFDIDDEKDDA